MLVWDVITVINGILLTDGFHINMHQNISWYNFLYFLRINFYNKSALCVILLELCVHVCSCAYVCLACVCVLCVILISTYWTLKIEVYTFNYSFIKINSKWSCRSKVASGNMLLGAIKNSGHLTIPDASWKALRHWIYFAYFYKQTIARLSHKKWGGGGGS